MATSTVNHDLDEIKKRWPHYQWGLSFNIERATYELAIVAGTQYATVTFLDKPSDNLLMMSAVKLASKAKEQS